MPSVPNARTIATVVPLWRIDSLRVSANAPRAAAKREPTTTAAPGHRLASEVLVHDSSPQTSRSGCPGEPAERSTIVAATPDAQNAPFRLDEATIDDLHAAIKSGRTTCVPIVQHYIDRVRAYNGVASLLVTEDGLPIPEARGAVRGLAPLRFPTETVKASTILPDLHKYKGVALELGRMEATASDPAVQQQYGMIVGKPNAGQLNAIATLNIRGERSVTCRGDFDRHPSAGPLPPGAPPVCEMFRRLPDALERA